MRSYLVRTFHWNSCFAAISSVSRIWFSWLTGGVVCIKSISGIRRVGKVIHSIGQKNLTTNNSMVICLWNWCHSRVMYPSFCANLSSAAKPQWVIRQETVDILLYSSMLCDLWNDERWPRCKYVYWWKFVVV